MGAVRGPGVRAQLRWLTLLPMLGLIASCTAVRLDAQPPATARSVPPPPILVVPKAVDQAPPTPGAATIVQPVSRWVPVTWNELPGWADDRLAQTLPALRKQCEPRPTTAGAPVGTSAGSSSGASAGGPAGRSGGPSTGPSTGASPAASPPATPTGSLAALPVDPWPALCAELARLREPVDDVALRTWLMQRFEPHRVEALDGRSEGLATGYFEPLLEASRRPKGAQRHALHRVPTGLTAGQPWFTRKESQTLPAAQAALRGREIAYVADPLDVLVVQIQGSGRVAITEPDGRRTLARLAFAAHNERPYQSVGRWLIDRGELKRDGASWPAIRDWARRNPARVDEMLWTNPRLVFFREEPLPDATVGPRGAQGVPLTAERSIAVDPRSIPYGLPVWLDTTEPSTARPLRRLVVAQDTGGAITGAVRADYFWGAGERAEREAGRMKQPVRMFVLVPKGSGSTP